MRFSSLVVGELETNCYIITPDKMSAEGAAEDVSTAAEKDGLTAAAVIDPAGDVEVIIAALERGHLFPRYILLTHGHYDHCAALSELYRHYGGKPQVAVTEADKHYLGADAYKAHYECFRAAGYAQFVDTIKINPLPEPALILHEGDEVAGLKCLLTPGHTEGSCVFYSEREKTLFSGDTLFCSGYGRTDLPGGDERKLYASLKRLLALPGETRVFPGHGGMTSIQDER
ncbi:MAG: MBL fold metallo-hydrolase [Spirochaetaceae bacterium]|jgi:glyoxylase-like metal-dependent hydrolase (beta-lactamase superfamily II)|nr:MBL fold metallo-hydrolase [Spirochaetaceae bacterium]